MFLGCSLLVSSFPASSFPAIQTKGADAFTAAPAARRRGLSSTDAGEVVKVTEAFRKEPIYGSTPFHEPIACPDLPGGRTKAPAGNLTKAPIGLAPVPDLTETIANMAASLGSLPLNQLSDEQQVGLPNNPAPNLFSVMRAVQIA
jgi:hypothetical protein